MNSQQISNLNTDEALAKFLFSRIQLPVEVKPYDYAEIQFHTPKVKGIHLLYSEGDGNYFKPYYSFRKKYWNGTSWEKITLSHIKKACEELSQGSDFYFRTYYCETMIDNVIPKVESTWNTEAQKMILS